MILPSDSRGVGRRIAGGLAIAACLLVTSLVAAGPVDAAPVSPAAPAQQPCGVDPYPPCPPPPPPTPVCVLDVIEAVVGGTVQVSVHEVPVGAAVQLLLGVTVVASGTVPDPPGDDPVADITLSFIVPPLAPGDYALVAVVGTLRLNCGVLSVRVIAGAAERGRGGLAFTGASILAFVALALLLLAVGYGLVRRSRARRHRVAEAERVHARTGWVREPVG